MFLSVREMELRKLRFDESFQPGEIQFFERKLWQASPLQVVGSAELLPNTGGEIRLRGRLSVRMEAECDRCLETASFPIDVSFDLYYESVSNLPEAEDVEIDSGEVEIDFYKGEGLELEDVLREQVLLSLPMQRVCREDCKGICPACGGNRNLVSCNCQVKPVDERWAALKNI